MIPIHVGTSSSHDIECEVVEGLEPYAVAELERAFGRRVRIVAEEPGSVGAAFAGDLRDLLDLRLPVAIYRVQRFRVPRPRALLGQQHLQALIDGLETVGELHPPGTFATFRLSAAGRDSAVMARVRAEIAAHTGLVYAPDEADLFVRIRPGRDGGWEVLTRLSPRPLSARAWRVRDFPGALHATIAAAMVEMTDPQPDDRFLNPFCGSGTLLVERLWRCRAQIAAGCDTDPSALDVARANLRAARFETRVALRVADARHLPYADRAFDVICADLPWGQLLGSHQENASLYPVALGEMARVAAPNARAALITQEARLMERVLAATGAWSPLRVIRLVHSGTYPRIYLLRRT